MVTPANKDSMDIGDEDDINAVAPVQNNILCGDQNESSEFRVLPSKIPKMPSSRLIRRRQMSSSSSNFISQITHSKYDYKANESEDKCTPSVKTTLTESSSSKDDMSSANAESVKELKQQFRQTFQINRSRLMNGLKFVEGSTAYKKVEQHQTKTLEDIEEFANALVRARDMEANSRMLKMEEEFQAGKEKLEEAEKKLLDTKNTHCIQAKQRETMQLNKMCEELMALEMERDQLKAAILTPPAKAYNQQTEEQESLQDTDHPLLTATESKLKVQEMELELNETKKQLEEAKIKIAADAEARRNEQELQEEILTLKKSIEGLEAEKRSFEIKFDQLQQENNSMKQLQVGKEKSVLHESEKSPTERSESPREHETEICKLHKSLAKERLVNANLEEQLSNAQSKIRRLEDQLKSDTQLLQVRSELINELQTKDDTLSTQLDELRRQNKEKDDIIDQIDKEVKFRTAEITLQQRSIDQLEENKKRLQKSRVQQELKIGELEEEISRLENAVRPYQHRKRN